MLQARCHCGAIRIDLAGPPAHLIDCNCSICRRHGALWARYAPADVTVSGSPDAPVAYLWGRHTLRTLHCRHCGCVTHWVPLDAQAGTPWGINMRNVDAASLEGVRIRRFDGAETWVYRD